MAATITPTHHLKSVTRFYESNDLRILRDALLKEHQLFLDKNGLVCSIISKESFKCYGCWETHIVTPLNAGETRGLIETICKALLRDGFNQQILFPFRMTHERHWVTGQVLIQAATFSVKIHDSANYYRTQEIENLIGYFFNAELKTIAAFLNEAGITIGAEKHKLLLERIAFRKARGDFVIKTGRSDIFPIQRTGTYCGGYATRLIINLVNHPEAEIRDASVWQCREAGTDEQLLRRLDAEIVRKNASEYDNKIFASDTEGSEYLHSESYRHKEHQEKKATQDAIGQIKDSLLKVDKESIERLCIQIKQVDRETTPDGHPIHVADKIRKLYAFCARELSLRPTNNPLFYFFSELREDISASRFNTAVSLEILWGEFKKLLLVTMIPAKRPERNPCADADSKRVMKERKDKFTAETLGSQLPLKTASVMVSRQTQAQSLKQGVAVRTYQGKSSLSEALSTKTAQGIAKSLDRLPDLLDKDHHIAWHKSHIGCLEKLLIIAQGKMSSQEFTLKDLEYVVHCANSGATISLDASISSILSVLDKKIKEFSILSVFNTTIKIVRLATKILSYLAANGRKLSPKAIEVLLKLLENSDKKIAFYATVAISYAINNRQDLSSTKSIEDKFLTNLATKIRSLMSDTDMRLHALVIVVGLAALALKKVKLSTDDLSLLKRALLYIGEPSELKSFFPKTSIITKTHPKSRISFFRTTLEELTFIKSTVKKDTLAKDEIEYAIRRWKDTVNTKQKRKSIQILRLLIENGQRDFSEETATEIISILKNAVSHDDRKIRSNAIVAMGYLINCTTQARRYLSLKPSLNKALTHQRHYTLIALNEYIEQHGAKNLTDLPQWLSILKPITTDEAFTLESSLESSAISSMARYMIAELTGDTDILKDLLLEKTFAVQSTLQFLKAAEKNLLIKEEVLGKFKKILLEDYPPQAQHNVIAILKLVAENKHIIPTGTMEAMIQYLQTTTQLTVKNDGLYAIAFYATKDLETILNRLVLTLLAQGLSERSLILSAIFLLKNILESLPELRYEKEFLELCINASRIFNTIHDPEIENSAILALLHAAKKGLVFGPDIFKELAEAINRPLSTSHQGKIVELFKYIIEQPRDNILPEPIILGLLKILQKGTDLIKNDITFVILLYLDKTTSLFTESIFTSLKELLNNTETELFVSEVIKKLVQKTHRIPISLLEEMAAVLIRAQDIETSINLSWAFRYTNQVLNKAILNHLFHAFKSIDDITENLVHTIYLSTVKNNIAFILTKEQVSQLLDIMLDVNQHDLRKYAAFILEKHTVLSRERLTTQSLSNLNESLDSTEPQLYKIILSIITLQTKYHHSGTRIKCLEISHFLKKVEENITNVDLQDEIIIFLKEIYQFGYFPKRETLLTLTDVLLEHQKEIIRNYSFEILDNLKKSTNLPKKVLNILELEKYIKSLEESEREKKDYRSTILAIYKIIVDKKQFLTKNNFMVFERILRNNVTELIASAVIFLYHTNQNGQTIPVSVLKELVKHIYYFKSNLLKHAINILTETAKRGCSIPEEIYLLFENLIIRTDIVSNIDCLGIIELSVRKRLHFKEKNSAKNHEFSGSESSGNSEKICYHYFIVCTQ